MGDPLLVVGLGPGPLQPLPLPLNPALVVTLTRATNERVVLQLGRLVAGHSPFRFSSRAVNRPSRRLSRRFRAVGAEGVKNATAPSRSGALNSIDASPAELSAGRAGEDGSTSVREAERRAGCQLSRSPADASNTSLGGGGWYQTEIDKTRPGRHLPLLRESTHRTVTVSNAGNLSPPPADV